MTNPAYSAVPPEPSHPQPEPVHLRLERGQHLPGALLVDERLLPGVALDHLAARQRQRVLHRDLAALLDDRVGRARLCRSLLRRLLLGVRDRERSGDPQRRT